MTASKDLGDQLKTQLSYHMFGVSVCQTAFLNVMNVNKKRAAEMHLVLEFSGCCGCSYSAAACFD